MAAFINALMEEGTREDALLWVHKQRRENGYPQEDDNFFSGWSKYDIIQELKWLWDHRLTRIKPHQGSLSQCSRIYTGAAEERGVAPNLGYFYRCHFVNHPFLRDDFGTRGHTSMVVREDGDEIETLNSRYTIVERWEGNEFV